MSQKRRSPRRPSGRHTPRRPPPFLERLEDRTAPAVYTVNSLLDAAPAADGILTLREALMVNTGQLSVSQVVDADHSSLIQGVVGDNDTIVFSVAGTIDVTSPLPTLARPLSIEGPGANILTVQRDSAAPQFRVFTVAPEIPVSLSGLTISGGNVVPIGGGILNQGVLTVSACTLSGNTASQQGGAIYNRGVLTITHSTLSGNTAAINGGGIYASPGLSFSVTVDNSTLAGNSAGFAGGGIYAGNEVILTNATVCYNSAALGGGIWTQFTIIPNNTIILNNTIVAQNTLADQVTPSDIFGNGVQTSSSNNNLTGTGGSGGLMEFTQGNLVGVARPLLAPLGDYGGPTETIALLPDSDAINRGSDRYVADGPTDQRGLTRTVDRTVDIGAFEDQPNQPPTVSAPVTSAANEDDPAYSVDLLAGATDPNGDVLHVSGVTLVAGDASGITVSGDSLLVNPAAYDLAPGVIEVIDYSYSVVDGRGGSVDQTATVTITGVNTLTVVSPTVSTDEDAPLSGNVLAGAVDSKGDAITAAAGTFATTEGGSVTIDADGAYTYTPAPGFFGTDSFGFTAQTIDDTTAGTVTVNVAYVNDLTVVSPTVSTDEGVPVSGNVLTGAVDAEGDPITATAGTFATTEGGSVTIADDGAYTYTPAAGFFGTDNFGFTAMTIDDTTAGTVTVNVAYVNDLTVVSPTVSTDEGVPLSGNVLVGAVDAEGDAITAVAGTFASTEGGSVTIAADGAYTYTPVPGFHGTDNFGFTAQTIDDTTAGTVTVNVAPVNDLTVVSPTVSTDEDVPLSGNVLAGAVDAGGDPITATAGTFATTEGGSVTIAADGAYTYTPAPGFFGTDNFGFTAQTIDDTTAGTVTVNVAYVNDLTVVSPTVSTDEGVPLTGNVLTGAVDSEGDPITAVAGTFATTEGGSVTIAADGAYTYTPAPGFFGTDNFGFTAQTIDDTTAGTVTVNVAYVNDLTVVSPTVSTDEDVPLSGNVLVGAVDAEGDAITAVAGTFATTAGGSVTIAADGAYTYTPAPGFFGTDSFGFTAQTIDDTTAGAVTVNVAYVNDLTVVSPTVSTNQDIPLNGNVLTGAVDAEGDPITATAGTFSTAQGGSVTIAADGAYTYTPAPGFFGTDSFGFTAQTIDDTTDGAVTVNVADVPPLVVAVLKTDASLLEMSGPNDFQTISRAGTILSISTALDAAGRTDVFAVTTDEVAPVYLNTLWEYIPGTGWSQLSTGSFAQVSTATNAAGQAMVFGVLTDGSLWEQDPARGTGLNAGWTELSPAGTIASVSAVTDAAGNAVAYAISSNPGHVGTLWEHSAALPGNGWAEISAGAFQQASAGLNGAGQAIVFGVLTDGSLWENNPAFGGDPVNNWTILSAAGTIQSVSAGGAETVFAITTGAAGPENLDTLWEFTPVAAWSQLSIGSFTHISVGRTVVAQDMVFATMTDSSFWAFSPGGAGGTGTEWLDGGVASSSTP